MKAENTLIVIMKLYKVRVKFLNNSRVDTGFIETGCYIDFLYILNTIQATSVYSSSIIEYFPDIINT